MVESSQPGGSEPDRATPGVLMISVACVQPIGRFASEAARCFIAVAPFGWMLEAARDLVGDAQLRQDFCDMNPGGRRPGVGHKNRIRRQQRLAQAGRVLCDRPADRRRGRRGRSRPAPTSAMVAGTTSFSSASFATSAAVRMTMSVGAPPRNLSAMAPTAPNSPPISSPVLALNAGARLPTSPCAAPPLKMFRRIMNSDPSPRSGCRA